jgi:hypothetical protein
LHEVAIARPEFLRAGLFCEDVAKELHDGHADQDVVVEDEHGPTVGRLAVPALDN